MEKIIKQRDLDSQIIRIAKEHGHFADYSANGGVNVFIAYTVPEHPNKESGTQVYHVRTLGQLKIALGY